jgi:hypothetical protein
MPPDVATSTPPVANTEAEPRVCYICMEGDVEAPGAVWVSACPCTLEVHESCLLHWIGEQEMGKDSGGDRLGGNGTKNRRKPLVCPACKEPIYVDEPYDAVVELRDRIHRVYGNLSPYVLALMVVGGTVAGLGSYGVAVATVFSGKQPVIEWLGFQEVLFPTRSDPGQWRWRTGGLLAKFSVLSLVGPTIIVARALPPVTRSVSVPLALAVSCVSFTPDGLCVVPPYLPYQRKKEEEKN